MMEDKESVLEDEGEDKFPNVARQLDFASESAKSKTAGKRRKEMDDGFFEQFLSDNQSYTVTDNQNAQDSHMRDDSFDQWEQNQGQM